MSNPDFGYRINRLKDEVTRFKSSICAFEVIDAARYPKNFEELGLDMAMKAEMLACSTRDIVSEYPKNSREYVLRMVSDAQGITVREDHGAYEIVMPYLMPKRIGRKNVEFILEPLSFAVEQFCLDHPIKRLDRAVIWFIYEYGEENLVRHIRDYDNMEAKEVLDMINAFFLIDDSGEFCELHYSSRRGKRNQTRIIISPDIGQFSCPKWN